VARFQEQPKRAFQKPRPIKGQQASNGHTTKKENIMPNLMEMTNTDITQHMRMMRIAEDNDLARKALSDDEVLLRNAGRCLRCKVMLTHGISSNTPEFITAAMQAVADFDAFTEETDPYGEHDFGSVIVDGQSVFWKIDYYDVNYEYGSDDPADLKITRRVLTIMLASEY
jgi:hypothetical protein